MNEKVSAFFDDVAHRWDDTNVIDEEVLRVILDTARVSEGKTVFDAGCGTGVLIPFLLERKVKQVVAADISVGMLEMAKRKFSDKRIEFLHTDITSFLSDRRFDCVVAHNSFPHFLDPQAAIDVLKRLTAPGGTLTVAHSISREKVEACHASVPEISLRLPSTEALVRLFGDGFDSFIERSDEKMYIVSAVKRTEKDQ